MLYSQAMEILILCSVVDNFGDIGFVYRLGRTLLECKSNLKINIVVDNLASFSKIAPEIQCKLAFQQYRGLNIYDWNNAEFCKAEFSLNFPQLIFQCFQCQRPLWLDDILFAKENKKVSTIINLEYLTAEAWADDFHLLKSATRSPLIKKINFMPGFTNKTGGLVLDKSFMACLKDRAYALNLLKKDLNDGLDALENPKTFCLLLFAYPKNFRPLAAALKEFSRGREICLFLSAGIQGEDFEGPFRIVRLPSLRQEAWDALLTLTDFNFIRGEDSFSRACLCGKPFIWHAYVQDEEFQLVKLDALLLRIKDYLLAEDYADFRRASLLYNRHFTVACGKEASDLLCREENFPLKEDENAEKKALLTVLEKGKNFKAAFACFSENLIKNGNLAQAILDFCQPFRLV